MRRTALLLAFAAGVACACPAAGQSPSTFTADVLVRKEGLGRVRVSPDDRWIAFEVQAPYDTASVYRYAQSNHVFLTDIAVYDAQSRTVRYRLQSEDRTAGHVAGPFSPDGRRMVVYRLTRDRWTLGVLDLETGAVEWTGFTPEETQFGRSVGWRSPDELIVVTRPDHSLPILFKVGFQPQERISDLWAATESGTRVGAAYIPSGARRDTRAQALPLQLRLVNIATDETRLLAEGAIYDFMLSPDGRRLAIMEEREDLQPDPRQAVRVGDPMRRRALRLLDLDGGTETALDRSLDYSPYFLTWREDSNALLAFARSPGAGDFGAAGGYVVIGADGRVDDLAPGAGSPAIARSIWGEPVALGGWRGREPILRVHDASGAARWRSPTGSIDMEALPNDRLVTWAGQLRIHRGDRLLSLDLADPATGVLTGRGGARDVGNRVSWTPDDDAYWALRTGGCLQPATAAAPRCVTDPGPDEQVLAAGAEGTFLVTRQDGTDGASSFRLHFEDEVATIATVNADRPALDWGELVEVPHPGPDGAVRTSWLLLPPSLPEGARAPLVVDVYVGRTASAAPRQLGRGSSTLQNNPAVIAAAGYAVLMISLPNPPEGRFSGAELADRLLGIVDRAAMDARVDAARVALIGHSYGGYNVLQAAPHSPRFGAVIASNGVADLSTTFILPPLYRTAPEEGVPIGTSAGWAETGQADVGVFPEHADRYIAQSPLYQVETLTAPTLLIETDLDRPRYGALFGALYRLDREAAWLNYFGEGHTVASPANVRDLHAHILDWLARYLGPPVGDAPLPIAGPGLEDGGE
jgi:dipeptidyl aminopeptidase/acylaminoacyl peptidase